MQFPPTPPSALIGGFKDRCYGLLQFPSLPVIAASAIEQMRVSRSSEIDRLFAQTQIFVGGESGFRSDFTPGSENARDDVFLTYFHVKSKHDFFGFNFLLLIYLHALTF